MENEINISQLSYIKSLDGVRGLAVILVVLFHSPIPMFQFEFGWVGVNLFFILSGFLITRILIKIKSLSFIPYIKEFYFRRILRIFPLYFFYLIVIYIILNILIKVLKWNNQEVIQGISDLENNYKFMVSYTYNFGTIINFLNAKNYLNSVFTGHLWTLSVEVQFYIISPIIIYFTPLKHLRWICISILLIIPPLRLFTMNFLLNPIHDFYWKGVVLYNSTIFQFDSFAIGACLVLFSFKHVLIKIKYYIFAIVSTIILVGALHLFFLGNYQMEISSLGFDAPLYHISKKPSPYKLFNHRYFYIIPIVNILFASLILVLIKKIALQKIFINHYLVFIGKISFGIYIYHLALSNLYSMFINEIFHKQIEAFQWPWQIILMFCYLLLLVLISNLSFKYFESRFLRLKRYFIYKNNLKSVN